LPTAFGRLPTLDYSPQREPLGQCLVLRFAFGRALGFAVEQYSGAGLVIFGNSA
jgi:hypothetical protein